MKQKRLLTISSIFVLVVFTFVSQTKLNSHPTAPDAGYVNDPDPAGALTCANSGCHGGTAIADSTMFTVQMGLFSAGTGAQANVVSGLTTYQADSSYYMTVTGNGTAPRYGFELTVIDNAPTPGNMAGNIVLTNTANTTLGTYTPSGSTQRKYAGHKNANTTKTWTFKWVAPHTGLGPLTIYYCGMNSNNNGNTSGDLVYKSTRVIREGSPATGINENAATTFSGLHVFPTVFSNELQLSFDLKETAPVMAEVMSMNGQLVKTLLNETINEGSFQNSYNMADLPAGIYLVKMQTGNALVVKKVVKQ